MWLPARFHHLKSLYLRSLAYPSSLPRASQLVMVSIFLVSWKAKGKGPAVIGATIHTGPGPA